MSKHSNGTLSLNSQEKAKTATMHIYQNKNLLDRISKILYDIKIIKQDIQTDFLNSTDYKSATSSAQRPSCPKEGQEDASFNLLCDAEENLRNLIRKACEDFKIHTARYKNDNNRMKKQLYDLKTEKEKIKVLLHSLNTQYTNLETLLGKYPVN